MNENANAKRSSVVNVKGAIENSAGLVVVGNRPLDDVTSKRRNFVFGKNRRRNAGGKFAPGMKKQLLFLSLPRVDIAEEVKTSVVVVAAAAAVAVLALSPVKIE